MGAFGPFELRGGAPVDHPTDMQHFGQNRCKTVSKTVSPETNFKNICTLHFYVWKHVLIQRISVILTNGNALVTIVRHIDNKVVIKTLSVWKLSRTFKVCVENSTIKRALAKKVRPGVSHRMD